MMPDVDADEVAPAGPYRDGAIHVLAARCPTCVFRPGNPMALAPGRVRGMVDDAVAAGSAITCHSTIYRDDDVEPAVCRGFYDAHAHRVQALQVAQRLDMVVEDAVPPKLL